VQGRLLQDPFAHMMLIFHTRIKIVLS